MHDNRVKLEAACFSQPCFCRMYPANSPLRLPPLTGGNGKAAKAAGACPPNPAHVRPRQFIITQKPLWLANDSLPRAGNHPERTKQPSPYQPAP